MNPLQVVVDTNVVLSALRSTQGASYRLLTMVGDPRWRMHVSVALLLQYEAVARRVAVPLHATMEEADKFIDYLCAASEHQGIYFTWRPQLTDPNDEFILELAVAAGAGHIITFNRADFQGAEKFGINVVEPREFLRIIGEVI
ncbi:MAG TPA: putative toxin-antitoxin system toxin component, PIN family [Candidatus Saccharimonadales bacterium]|nr:putative toxin-antitoxin system toxin component, PIN family [Candidatus Saccharimonadales bacterium]